MDKYFGYPLARDFGGNWFWQIAQILNGILQNSYLWFGTHNILYLCQSISMPMLPYERNVQ